MNILEPDLIVDADRNDSPARDFRLEIIHDPDTSSSAQTRHHNGGEWDVAWSFHKA